MFVAKPNYQILNNPFLLSHPGVDTVFLDNTTITQLTLDETKNIYDTLDKNITFKVVKADDQRTVYVAQRLKAKLHNEYTFILRYSNEREVNLTAVYDEQSAHYFYLFYSGNLYVMFLTLAVGSIIGIVYACVITKPIGMLKSLSKLILDTSDDKLPQVVVD